MTGKKVNISMGILLILVAIYICILPYIKDIAYINDYTRYDKQIFEGLEIIRNVLIISLSIVSILFAIANRVDGGVRNSYLLMPLLLIYFAYPLIYFAIIPLISAIGIIYYTSKKNYVSIDSYIILTFVIVTIFFVSTLFLVLLFENKIAEMFRKEHESKIGIQDFDKEFFKYIPEDKETPPYINLKIKKGDSFKYGYIDNIGNITIPKNKEFNLDFATPFYTIEQFGKKFQIAGVSKGDVVEVIMKNERRLMSYVSKYNAYDFEHRMEEFIQKIKENILQDDLKIVKEIQPGSTNVVKKPAISKDEKESCTYKYRLSEDKDILIYESKLGNPTRYTMKDRKAPFKEIELDTSTLIYDKESLYTFKNNTIPFFDREKNEQGWFMEDGEKITLTGNAQILDINKDRVLVKNHTKNTAYFIDYNSKIISPIFRDIIVDNDRYLIKTLEDKWIVTDTEYNKVFNESFDIINTSMLSAGIYALANIPEDLEFDENGYVKLSYMVITRRGFMIVNDVRNILDINYKFEGDKNNPEDIKNFKSYLRVPTYINFGDKFYQ